MRRLATPRLVLEPQTAAHAEALFAALSDPALYRHENEPPASLEWLRARLERLESRRSADGTEHWLNWVMRRAGGEVVGYVQATLHPDGHAAIAYVLASAHWGRGLATEAVEAMIDELARGYAVRRLTAVLKRDNERSMRLLDRLGFAAASPDEEARAGIDSDERLMHRPVGEAPRPHGAHAGAD